MTMINSDDGLPRIVTCHLDVMDLKYWLTNLMRMDFVNMNSEQIYLIYANHGRLQYDGEPVTQIQHGWQCAQLAARSNSSIELQLAAWLHDLGHLITGLPGSPTVNGINDQHEFIGSQLLQSIWGNEVSQPVLLHVAAKRYLVTMQANYKDRLSEDSLRSLELQGGLMSDSEISDFESNPYMKQSLLIRTWDDLGKSGLAQDNLSTEEQLLDLKNLMLQVDLKCSRPSHLMGQSHE